MTGLCQGWGVSYKALKSMAMKVVEVDPLNVPAFPGTPEPARNAPDNSPGSCPRACPNQTPHRPKLKTLP